MKTKALHRTITQTTSNLAFLIFFITIFITPLALVRLAWEYELGIASFIFLTMYWWVYGVCKAYKNPVH